MGDADCRLGPPPKVLGVAVLDLVEGQLFPPAEVHLPQVRVDADRDTQRGGDDLGRLLTPGHRRGQDFGEGAPLQQGRAGGPPHLVPAGRRQARIPAADTGEPALRRQPGVTVSQQHDIGGRQPVPRG